AGALADGSPLPAAPARVSWRGPRRRRLLGQAGAARWAVAGATEPGPHAAACADGVRSPGTRAHGAAGAGGRVVAYGSAHAELRATTARRHRPRCPGRTSGGHAGGATAAGAGAPRPAARDGERRCA